MKATHRSSARRAGIRALICALLLPFGPHSQAELSAAAYDTPAYIDFQFGEWSVSEDAAELEIVVHRTGEFRESFTLEYETVEESATQGRDYKGTGGTVVFKPMETFKSIKIGILRDDLAEDPEIFRVTLSSSEPKAFFVRDTAIVTINDAAPALPALKVRAGAAGTIVLSWSGERECVLERASSIDSEAWETVEAEITRNGEQCEVTQAISNPVYLYRLRQK